MKCLDLGRIKCIWLNFRAQFIRTYRRPFMYNMPIISRKSRHTYVGHVRLYAPRVNSFCRQREKVVPKWKIVSHPPFSDAIFERHLDREISLFDHWGLFFRCHSDETTNQRPQNSLSWPGCLLIKWRTKSFFEVSSQKAKCSWLLNAFYHSEGRNKVHWPLNNPKGLSKYNHFCT